MRRGWLAGALLFGLVAAAIDTSWAQQRSLGPNQPSIMNEEDDGSPADSATEPAKPARTRGQQQTPALETDPNLDAADQLAPSQIRQPMPAAVAEPSGTGRGRSASRGADAAMESGASAKLSPMSAQDVIVCSGVFGRDSNHLKLARAFQARNIGFMLVDGGTAGKVMASVLFAKDPKRRLEVWWSDSAAQRI
jgi:hypothetical protein